MSLLDRAVETIESWGAEQNQDRARCAKLLAQVVEQMDRGIAIWQEFLVNAPESGDRFTAVLWIGSEPARKLHSLYLENKQTAIALTELTGVRFKDSLSLCEELDIVQAYEQLKSGESGGDRATEAIRLMSERREMIQAALSRLAE